MEGRMVGWVVGCFLFSALMSKFSFFCRFFVEKIKSFASWLNDGLFRSFGF